MKNILRGGIGAVWLRRAGALLLAGILAATLIFSTEFTAFAKDDVSEKHSGTVSADKTVKTYDIAVAYDNSGSMYKDGVSAWYQAKYAMEIFASMMDPENGDKLTIFPMHEVTVGSGSTVNKIEVRSVADINKIHNMSTPRAGGTPFKTVVDAYNYLKTSSADEKWLIVLTDGGFSGTKNPQSEMEKMAKSVKVQFIPFGSESVAMNDTSSTDNFFASPKITDEAGLQSVLIGACNRIFQRDELKGKLKGKELRLDISMKKLIVFVQGQNAKIEGLKTEDGQEIEKLVDSGQRTYSELSHGKNVLKLPESLKGQTGQVVTFGACQKGKYQLYISNASDVQIFYEPDVTMVIDFINSDGEVEDFTDGEAMAGDYTYNVKLIDSKTGEDVSKHELLGGKVVIDGNIVYPDGEKKELKNGDTVTLTPDEDVSFDISATYLDIYHLRSLDAMDIDWSSINIIPDEASLKVKATVKQKSSWYAITESDKWKPIRLDLTLGGQPLSDEQVKAATVDFKLSDSTQKLSYRTEPIPGESAINLYIAQDENGNFVKPDPDKYTAGITVTAADEYGTPAANTKPEKVSFEISNESYWAHFAKELIKWLIIFAVIAFILGIPCKPKKVFITTKEPLGYPCSRRINAVISSEDLDVVFSADARTHWKWFKNSWVKRVFLKSKGMDCIFANVSKGDDVSELSLERYNGKVPPYTFTWKFDGKNKEHTGRIRF